MKKIFIIYATAGEGHKKAALAVKAAFDVLKPQDTEVRLIDALDYTDDFFRRSYPAIYLFMVTYLPIIWGFFYYWLDAKWFYPILRRARRIVNAAHGQRLEKFLVDSRPDAIVATHFLASEVAAELKRQGRINSKLVTVVTDFRMHSFWFAPNTDCFCVGFEETKGDLVKKWAVDARKIRISGIPIDPKFDAPKDKAEVQSRLGLDKDLFTVFVTSGGFGVGPILTIVRELIDLRLPMQILVVCGHNQKLKDQIDKLPITDYRLPITIKSFGFIDYMDEIMVASDAIITKSGGLICSEAVAKGLPLIITAPIPGQETRNARLLLLRNAALKLKKPRQTRKVIGKIYKYAKESDLLLEMRKNISGIRTRDSSANVARIVLDAAYG